MPGTDWPTTQPDLASQVVDLVNQHRAQLGLPGLVVSPTLTASATWKARNMAAFDYMEHDDPAPTSRTAGERIADCGYANFGWGENIAMGYASARDVVDAWLASPPHRANIEDPEFRATGVAVAGSPGHWSQTFGTAVDGIAARVSSSRTERPTTLAVSAADSSVAPATVRVHCRPTRGRVTCRVLGGKGAALRITVVRGGATYARAKARLSSDDTQLHLRVRRGLHAGHYALLVRVGLPSGTKERRVTFSVR